MNYDMMKKLIFLLLVICTQFSFAKQKQVYVLIWGSTQTFSGAGHVSVAFQNDSSVEYFTHYPEADGGGKHLIKRSIAEVVNVDQYELYLQNEKPSLVLSFLVSEKEYYKMLSVARMKIKKKWSLFLINCADFTKQIFRKSKFDLGLAFGISTPVELVKDLHDHNKDGFESGRISASVGDLDSFLNAQPRAVPNVIRKWWNRLLKNDSIALN